MLTKMSSFKVCIALKYEILLSTLEMLMVNGVLVIALRGHALHFMICTLSAVFNLMQIC